MVDFLLSGRRMDEDALASLRDISGLYPTEFPLDLATAKCRILDSKNYDDYAKKHGRPRGTNALVAHLIATDQSLIYIAPKVLATTRFPWIHIDRVESTGRFGASRTLQIIWQAGSVEVTIGRAAAENFEAVADWACDRTR
jgi:hypothetical protein